MESIEEMTYFFLHSVIAHISGSLAMQQNKPYSYLSSLTLWKTETTFFLLMHKLKFEFPVFSFSLSLCQELLTIMISFPYTCHSDASNNYIGIQVL